MTDETTSEQLAEIEGQATEYTPPEGWRVLQVGERLRDGDVTVRRDGYQYPTERVGGWVGSNQRYIRPIEPQPQPKAEPQPEPQPVQVREGRWRTRGGHYVCVESMSGDDFASIAYGYTWRGCNTPELQWNDNGLREIDSGEQGPMDLVEYLGPIEPDKTQDLPETGEESPDQLIGRISLLRRRVTQLEELVGSLRTINEAQEKAFNAVCKANTDLRHRLNTVAAELVTQAETSRRLQIELDAAHQVPADSPELRQLRADLEQMTLGRDTYRDGYNRLLSDLETIRETTAADTVEAIVEWLQAFRGCNSPSLALLLIEALPSIMRSLTGLNDEEIE